MKNIIERVKNLFSKPEPELPPIPKSVTGYTQWLDKHHPAFQKPAQPDEIGGPMGPEPTRYGTWEKGGIDHDF